MQRENSSSSRRTFIKTSAAVSAAALAANLPNFVHAQGSDVIKVGLIGCGGRGRGAAGDCLNGARNAGAQAQIVAAGDVFERSAKSLDKRYGVPADKLFWGIDAYKKVVDSGVDMVILATPPGFRPYHFQYAIEQGKNVFFEKPVAVDPAGIRIVMKAADMATEKKLAVVAGTQRRHEGNYFNTVKRIQDGAIGEVQYMYVRWDGGGIWNRAREDWMSDVEYQINNWYHYVWLCGDQICEQHVHNLDIAHWVMGGPPTSCYAQGGRQVRTTPGQIWDHFAVKYDFPGGRTVWSTCRHWPGDGGVDEFCVGTKGTSNPGGWVRPAGGEQINGDGTGNGYVNEHRDLIKSIRDGKPLNEAKQVAISTMMAIMGRMSAYSGKRVTWDFVMNKSTLDTMPKDLDIKGKMPEPPVPVPGKQGTMGILT